MSWAAVATSLALYPGLAAAVAVRSVSTLAVAVVAALLLAAIFAVVMFLSVIGGHGPEKRFVVIGLGLFLAYGAIVIGAAFASQRLRRRRVAWGEAAGFGVGIVGTALFVLTIFVGLRVLGAFT